MTKIQHLNETLYQYDTKGKIRVWNIRVEEENNSLCNIISEAGIENGAMVKTTTPITEGKNIGKANETTIIQQAIADAKTEINKKIKSGYTNDRNNIKSKEETATIKKPMKGYAYSPNPNKTNPKDKSLSLDDLDIRNKEIGIQRKLDGWRCIIYVDDTDIIFHTSSGEITLPFPQIEQSIRRSYDLLKEKQNITSLFLDGEIYRHNLNLIKDNKNNITNFFYKDNTSGFNATASACASTKNITPIKQNLRDQMQFHIFDVCLEIPYSERRNIIENFYSDTVIPVETIYIKGNEKEIDELFISYLEEGYEGLMIRKLDTPYQHKRSKQLTKYKPFEDDEFKIIGFKESVEGNTLGSLEIELNDKQTAFANLKEELGTDMMKLEIWNNKEKYLGKWVTVEFMGYTPDNSLRHPRAKAFRKGKSLD